MKVEVKIVQEEDRKDVADRDRRTFAIQVHSKRGDGFNVDKVDNVVEGTDTVLYEVPNGGRLVITAPYETAEVYDPAQGAAVVKANQTQSGKQVADIPKETDEQRKEREAKADAAQRAEIAKTAHLREQAVREAAEAEAKRKAAAGATGVQPRTPPATGQTPTTPVKTSGA